MQRVVANLFKDRGVRFDRTDQPSFGANADAVRCVRLALDRGLAGVSVGPSGYFMTSPPQQFPDHVVRELTLAFIGAHAGEEREEANGDRTRASRHVRAAG